MVHSLSFLSLQEVSWERVRLDIHLDVILAR